MKNPTIATLLNLIPGLGYLYVGGKKKTFGFLLLATVITGTVASLDPALADYMAPNSEATLSMWAVASILSVVLGVAAFMYDGYASALAHNASHSKKKK